MTSSVAVSIFESSLCCCSFPVLSYKLVILSIICLCLCYSFGAIKVTQSMWCRALAHECCCVVQCWCNVQSGGRTFPTWPDMPMDGPSWPRSDPGTCEGFFGNGFILPFDLMPRESGGQFNCSYHPGINTIACEAGILHAYTILST